jgi:regulator of protease activity HflC (stomatin/prohibitin superfamily)
MRRHEIVIIKETHRGLLYEDGRLAGVLGAGRHAIRRPGARSFPCFGSEGPASEVVLVDVRGRDRTVVVADLLTADGVAITASFAVQYRVVDPVEAVHAVKSFEDRLYAEVQTVARRLLRALRVEEVLAGRDEVGEELFRRVRESAATFGLGVDGLDFKDLVVPDAIRDRLLRAAVGRELRPDEGFGEVGDDTRIVASIASEDVEPDPDADAELIIAKASFRASCAVPNDQPAPLRRRHS